MKQTVFKFLILSVAWLVVSLPAFFVLPALDDWTRSSPICFFSWDLLRPGVFWRPIEILNRMLVGFYKDAYPTYPHLLAVLGHGLSGFMLFVLIRKIEQSFERKWFAVICTVLFFVSPAVCASVWSVDSAIQTWSTALGLASAYVYLFGKGKKSIVGWILLAGIATLWKESGLCWFVAVPLLHKMLIEDKIENNLPQKDFWQNIAIGFFVIVIYWGLRWIFAAEFFVGGIGRYSLSINPIVWAKNAAMLIGVAATTIDTIAIFGPVPRYWLGIVTFLCSLPLLAFVLYCVWRDSSKSSWIFAFLIVVAVLGPHLPLTQVSEMYAHPILAILILLSAIGLVNKQMSILVRRGFIFSIVLFFVSAFFVDWNKLTAMIQTGEGADEVGQSIVRQIPIAPRHVCLVAQQTKEKFGYSVFLALPGPAAKWGMSAQAYWGWENKVKFSRVSSVTKCPAQVDKIIVVGMDGSAFVL